MQSKDIIWILEDDPACNLLYQKVLDARCKTRYFGSFPEIKEALISLRNGTMPSIQEATLIIASGKLINEFKTKNKHQFLGNHPFMIVSDSDDLETMRLFFEKGAMDYLVRPLNTNELTVKVERILASLRDRKKNVFNINPTNGPVIPVENLTSKETLIVTYFLNAPSHTLARETLQFKIWGPQYKVHPKTLDVHLYNLRKKLAPYDINIQSVSDNTWQLVLPVLGPGKMS